MPSAVTGLLLLAAGIALYVVTYQLLTPEMPRLTEAIGEIYTSGIPTFLRNAAPELILLLLSLTGMGLAIWGLTVIF